jgi:hypothetical protein
VGVFLRKYCEKTLKFEINYLDRGGGFLRICVVDFVNVNTSTKYS